MPGFRPTGPWPAQSLDADTEAIGADQVWSPSASAAAGVRIAVLDTGVKRDVDDLKLWHSATSRIVAWKDFVGGQTSSV